MLPFKKNGKTEIGLEGPARDQACGYAFSVDSADSL